MVVEKENFCLKSEGICELETAVLINNFHSYEMV